MGESTPWGVAVFVLVPILAVLISIVFRQKKYVSQDINSDEIRRIAKMEAQILLFEELKPIHKELSKISGDIREMRTVLETLGIKGFKRASG